MSLTVLSGLPGAGKSTLARKLAFETGAEIIARDSLRHYFPTLSELDLMFKIVKFAESFLLDNISVIVDECNLEPIDRTRWIDLSYKLGIELKWIYINTPIDVCVERDARRPNSIGSATIYTIAAQNGKQIEILEEMGVSL